MDGWTFIITFHTASIPKHIKIGYLRIPVELYIPNPLHCFNCQKFGHGKKHVREEKSAPIADRLDTTAVLAAMKQNAPTAPVITLPLLRSVQNESLKKVQRLKAENNISFAEARKAAAAENESRPSHDTRTVAEVVRLRSEPPPPVTRSIKIQTELTWPNNQETPATVPTSVYTSHTVYTTHSKHSQTSLPVSTEMTSTTSAAQPDTPMRPNRRDQERKHALSAGHSTNP